MGTSHSPDAGVKAAQKEAPTMAPIYINAEASSARKTLETIVSDSLTIGGTRPIVIVGRMSHFHISFKKGEVTLSLFEESDSKLTKLASFNSYYVAVEPILEAFCLLIGNLGDNLG